MSIKVIVANNNDVLFNNLSNLALQYKPKVEVINVPTDKLSSFICHIKRKNNLIILDTKPCIFFYENILKNALKRLSKRNVIILVIDSEKIVNTISQVIIPQLSWGLFTHNA